MLTELASDVPKLPLSPLRVCFPSWRFNWSSRWKDLLHDLNLQVCRPFTPWIFRCLARFDDSENFLPQMLHSNGFSFVCVRSWIAIFCQLTIANFLRALYLLHALCWGNALPQYLQAHGFSPVWSNLCCCMACDAENALPQISHVEDLSPNLLAIAGDGVEVTYS